jgi:hypothetical protein
VFSQSPSIMKRSRGVRKETPQDIARCYVTKSVDPPWVVEKFVDETVGRFGFSCVVVALCLSLLAR